MTDSRKRSKLPRRRRPSEAPEQATITTGDRLNLILHARFPMDLFSPMSCALVKCVLFTIGGHAGDDGDSWPGYGTISAEACCSRATAIRAVERLAARNLISVTKCRSSATKNESNWYVILWASLLPFVPSDDVSENLRRALGGTSLSEQLVAGSNSGSRSQQRGGIREQPEPPVTASEPPAAAAPSAGAESAAAAELRDALTKRGIPRVVNERGDLAAAGAGILTVQHLREALDQARRRRNVDNPEAIAALKLWDKLDQLKGRQSASLPTAQLAAPLSPSPDELTCNGDRARAIRRQVEADKLNEHRRVGSADPGAADAALPLRRTG